MRSEINSSNYKSFFRWSVYQNLDAAQREQLVRTTVSALSKEKGLKEVNLSFFKSTPNSRGYCEQKTNKKGELIGHRIGLNDDVLKENRASETPYKLYNTINHELEHATWAERVLDHRNSNDNPEVLERRANDQHYRSSSGDKIGALGGRSYRFNDKIDYAMYSAQAEEAEARAAGLSAAKGLRETLGEDEHLENYLDFAEACEIDRARSNMQQLGMHAREHMLAEELQYVPETAVSSEQREKALQYAKEKDRETAFEVLRNDNAAFTDEKCLECFEQNDCYPDFMGSEEYQKAQASPAEHRKHAFGRCKFDEETAEAFEMEENVDGEEAEQSAELLGEDSAEAENGISELAEEEFPTQYAEDGATEEVETGAEESTEGEEPLAQYAEDSATEEVETGAEESTEGEEPLAQYAEDGATEEVETGAEVSTDGEALLAEYSEGDATEEVETGAEVSTDGEALLAEYSEDGATEEVEVGAGESTDGEAILAQYGEDGADVSTSESAETDAETNSMSSEIDIESNGIENSSDTVSSDVSEGMSSGGGESVGDSSQQQNID